MRAFLGLLLFLAVPRPVSHAEDASKVSVAAAADLTFCLDELSVVFGRMHPMTKLQVTTGASGNLFAQITRGAPFDVFMAADLAYPRQLVRDSGADEASLMTYAIGHLVLWTVKPGVDLGRGLEVIRHADVKKFAIPNPAHAPYGRAAKAALESAGVWKEVQDKLVLGENVAQTAQFVQTGNVDAGIVSLSVVLAPKLAGQGVYFELPETAHSPLEQGAVLTKRGAANPAARIFLEFLRSAEARVVFERYGFRLPPQRPSRTP